MNTNKMVYSWAAIHEAQVKGKAITWTAKRKGDHFPIACEVKKFFEWCSENINNYLFDPEYTPIKAYYRAAYDNKHYTNKELQSKLNRCKLYLEWELKSIINDMITGEVDSTD